MKELLQQYANYNTWANKRIIDAMLKLTDAQVDEEITSSFTSLRKTVYHTWGAEYIWLQRLEQPGQPVWVASDFTATFEEACGEWERASAALAMFADSQSDDSLKQKIHYSDLRKNAHNTAICDMLQHVFNHSTYHRGQMVTILRQLGVQEIPGTDLIGFVRMK